MKFLNLGKVKKSVLALTTAIAVGLTGASVAQTTEFTIDELIWSYVEQVGSADAYAAYLAENPNGQFANTARAMLLDMAERGIEPSQNVDGFENATLDQSLAAFIGERGVRDLSDYFVISYAS